MIELRPEQRQLVDKAKIILLNHGVVYIAGEIRTGKTPTAIITAKEVGWRRICLITKKGAISGVEKFTKEETDLDFTVTNFEQAGKLINNYDGFIIDESHACGQFSKPSNRTKILKELIGTKPVILMSGSPNPESRSQLYHQFWLTGRGPFTRYKTFYAFAKDFVDVKKKRINGWDINDYSHAREQLVDDAVAPYMVTLSQQDAGFTSFVEEEICLVPIDKRLYQLMQVLKKDKVYTMKSGDIIVCDTPVKMQSVFHQLSSGSIKIGDKRMILDESKAWFIKSKFAGQKIAIFHKFIAEAELLKRIFPNWTSDPEEFNRSTDKVFIRQFLSGREGVNLSTADALVMYNIDFSATTYWQVRGRMQEKDRDKASKLYWIFSEKGLEHFIYKAVVKKQSYTSKYFKKDLKYLGMEQLAFT
jgi:hypothetical protein